MKYKSLCLALSAAAVLCACNKNAGTESAQLPAWVLDESLEVPIEFGPGMTTKAAVEALPGAPLGIYGVDVEDGTVLLNHLAECKGSESILKFVDEVGGAEKVQCYPLGVNNNYTFFGYHVGTDEIEGEYEQISGAFVKEFPVGEADVLWAKSEATPVQKDGVWYDGFNARYSRVIRTLDNPSAYYPSLNFAHACTSLHFYVKAYDLTAANSFADGQVRITGISLTNVPVNAKLVICDKQNIAREGTLEPIGGLGTLARDGFEAVPTLAGTEISDGFFLLPGEYSDSELSFELTTNPVGTPTTYKVGTLRLPAGQSSFEAGKSYSYVIVIKSFDEMIIKASVVPWEEGFSAEEIENGDNVLITIE